MFLSLLLLLNTLDPSLQTFLKQRGVSPQTTSVYAVWADTGEPVTAYQEELPLAPASSLKILTTYCALKKLNIHHTFETNFYSDGPIQNGEIQTLSVEGKGDPTWVSERLWVVVQQLKGMGLKKIKGDIDVDATYFDNKDYPGRQENNERAYNAPISALSLNFNSAAITVYPPSYPVQQSFFPNIPYLHQTVSIPTTLSNVKEPTVFYRSVPSGPLFFGHALKALFNENGIEVTGQPKEKTAHGRHLLLKSTSKQLSEIVRDMNKFSNNFIAEQLVKYLGVQFAGTPGTTQKGVGILKECLGEMGINPHPFYIENGSGLSYKNKISAKAIVQILLKGLKDPSFGPEMTTSLSVAGRDGTMRSRKTPKELEGILRAKTGSLNGINSLTGFVPSKDGHLIAFAILMNRYRGGYYEGQAIQDRLIAEWRKHEKGR